MNNFERRKLVKAQVIDVTVAKTGVNASRRQRAEAARKLRKALAAKGAETVGPETVAYPFRAVG